jgi:hypothetical protein
MATKTKSKMGRPPKLNPDEGTISTVKGLGQIQATTKECAAVLGVTEPTFIKFKQDHKAVQDAYDAGEGNGRASLRRRQFKAADAGNATMLIWLGKQYLGQSDKQLIGGDEDNPVNVIHTIERRIVRADTEN